MSDKRWTLTPGIRVGEFDIERPLGRGAMGEVYLARDRELDRLVALKLLRFSATADSGEQRERFLREARITARLDNPQIVTVHRAGIHDDRPFLVLEYVEGETLRTALERGPLDVREGVTLGAAIAGALAEAHRAGVLHLDLKPENVMRGARGIRVLDFGIAGLLAADGSDDTEAPAFGTPGYTAPERTAGDPPTAAADIYSLGVVLSELLGTPPAPVPRPLRALLDQCLSADPDRRPDAAEVARRLEVWGARPPKADTDEVENPYPGLAPFAEHQASRFHGREGELRALRERLDEHAAIPIVASSGSGKSSLVQAGLLPRMREEGWFVLTLRPGRDPLHALAAELQRAARSLPLLDTEDTPAGKTEPVAHAIPSDLALLRREPPDTLAVTIADHPQWVAKTLRALAHGHGRTLLLYVDAWEELFTQCPDDDEADTFAQAMLGAVSEDVRLIFTLRDDYLGRAAESPALEPHLGAIYVLRAPADDALLSTLHAPLDGTDHRFEDDSLPADMVASVSGERGSLALLQFTAHALWERRDRDRRLLTRAGYEALGGVPGALARHAGETLEALSPDALQTARILLLRLVSPEGTRVRVDRSALLAGLPPTAHEVLDRLLQARLVAMPRDGDHVQVELAHESLINRWDQLAGWLARDRGDVALADEIELAARRWGARGHREDDLWRGGALAEAQRLLARDVRDVEPSSEAIAFLERSQDREGAQLRAQRRRRRGVIAGLGALSAIAVATAAGLFLANRRATKQQKRAQLAERDSRRNASQAQAESRRARARQRDALLSVGWLAIKQQQVQRARAAARAALELGDGHAARHLWWSVAGNDEVWARHLTAGSALAVDKARRQVAVAGAGVIRVFDIATGIERSFPGKPGMYAVTADPEHPGAWLFGTKRGVFRLDRGGRITAVAKNPRPGGVNGLVASGTALAWGHGKTVRLRAAPGSAVKVLLGFKGQVLGVKLVAGGKLLLAWDDRHTIQAFSFPDGKQKLGLRVPSAVLDATAGPRGQSVILATRAGLFRSYIASQRTQRLGDPIPVSSVTADPIRARIYVARSFKLETWDLEPTPKLVSIRPLVAGQSAWFLRVARATPPRQIVAIFNNDWLRVRRIAQTAPIRDAIDSIPTLGGAAFIAKGHRFVVATKTELVWFEGGTGPPRVESRVPVKRSPMTLAYSPDGKCLAFPGEGEELLLKCGNGAVRTLRGHRYRPSAVAWGSSGTLYSAGLGGDLIAWKPPFRTPRYLKRLGRRQALFELAVAPQEKHVATRSVDGRVRVWDVQTGTERFSQPARPIAPLGLTFTPQGELLIGGRQLQRCVWTQKRCRTVPQAGYVRSVAMHPDGRRAFLVVKNTVRELTLKTGNLRSFMAFGLATRRLAISGDGRRLVATRAGGSLSLFDITTGRPLWWSSVATPEGRLHTPAGWRDLATGKPKRVPPKRWHGGLAAVLEGDASRTLVCLARFDGQIGIWDRREDRRLVRRALPNVRQIVALEKWCVFRTTTKVVALGPKKARWTQKTGKYAWIAQAGNGLVLLNKGRIHRLDPTLKTERDRPAPLGTVTVGSAHGHLIAGLRHGGISLLPPHGPPRTLPLLSNRPVVTAAPGPANLVVIGSSDGKLGAYNLTSGRRIAQRSLIGSVNRLIPQGTKVFATSHTGDSLALDFSSLSGAYCDLLRRVWKAVPVLPQKTTVVAAPPPPGHRCAAGKSAKR